MGHRTVNRVPLDFDWPRDKTWEGYLLPEWLHERSCEQCGGSGDSPEAQFFHDKWYGEVPFDPSETDSPRLTLETPAVRAFAERNVSRSPEFYGTGEVAIEREARRLADLWNGQWCHHLEQADVDALVEAKRLHDFTHTWTKGTGWQPRDPMPAVTAAEVNAWSIDSFGHDSINCWVVVRARCERDGVPHECSACDGHGSAERWPGQRATAEAWKPTEPPKGPGWQLWETTSEGSPVSPVAASAEELAGWAAQNATAFADMTLTAEQWLHSFTEGTTDVDTLLVVTKSSPLDGVHTGSPATENQA